VAVMVMVCGRHCRTPENRVLACVAGIKAGCDVHLCRVTGNTVWSHTTSDTVLRSSINSYEYDL